MRLFNGVAFFLSKRIFKRSNEDAGRSSSTSMGKSSTFPSLAKDTLRNSDLDAGVGSLSRTKSQQATSLSAAHKLVNFSSFRIAKPSPSPLRRNTTRGARPASQSTVHTSDNSLRQLSVDPTLLHSAPDTRNASPNLSEGNLRSVSMNFNNTASEHGR